METPRKVVNWDRFWISHAVLASTKSKDPSTQVGCVIVSQDNQFLTEGYNGFPRGVIETPEEFYAQYWTDVDPFLSNPPFTRWERPEKYSWVEHAERNAVFSAARYGIPLKGAKAYLNWSPDPCEQCSRALIQAGIVEVIGTDVPFAGKGAGINYNLTCGQVMFKESGVKIRVVTGYLNETKS